MVVTAGHCLYDWRYMGGFLRYVKCYFGYEGEGSPGVYRYGVTAAAPAEYLKAESSVHDVSFIRLNEKVTDIKPIHYSVTPPKGTAQLGVVGYPGDLDFGRYLYEHWTTVEIDLAKTGTLLSYLIDTTPVGVHIAGGYPNVGSVIGPYGNSFEEYILAMDVKDGLTKSSNVTIAQAKGLVTGFQLLSVQPQSIPYKSPSDSTIDPPNEEESGFDEKTGLDLLFGNGKPKPGNGKANGTRKAEGSLTAWPEKLKFPETDNPLPPVDIDKAVKNAKDQDDVKTTFFINFTEPLKGEALESQRKLMSAVKSWQAWATTNCEGKVQQQVDAGALPSDSKGQVARSTYRAKVFDFLFNHSTWFAKTMDQAMSKEIKTKAVSFHPQILTNVLEGYSIPSTVFTNLEKVLKQIAEGIKLSGETSKEAQQYWVMFTKYQYEEISQNVQADIRIISFQVTKDAKHYASQKGSYDEVKFDLNFHQYQAEFVQEIFDGIKDKMNKKQIEQGQELIENGVQNMDIPIN
ncbi:hypothetical protein FVER14953_21145 [Fusarium verticillioides]|nr:hypothetical protein FVER14953_21145 [Fusarium verticillioides]